MGRTLNLLSVVVPCHNEMEVLPSTHERLKRVLSGLMRDRKISDYRIVYVNNGSTDKTQQVLDGLFASDKRTRVIALRRNFGYQGSISAGLYYAEGDAVVTIDSDLQDPPEKIGEMIGHFQNDYDLVLGVRQDRSSDSMFKRFFSEGYYKFLKKMGVEVIYNHGDFRLMARSLVDEFNALVERNRFIRAMILKLDTHYAVVAYERSPRRAGKTKFDIRSLLSLSIDGIVSFSYAPLRLVSILGLIIFSGSIFLAGWVLYIKYTTGPVPGWASTALPIFVFGGFQIFVLGLIGEYIGRLYIEVKQRPLFSLRKDYKHQ